MLNGMSAVARHAILIALISLLAITGKTQSQSVSTPEVDGDRVFAAIVAKDPNTLKLALNGILSMDIRDAAGATVLLRAAEEGSPKMVRIILNRGADPNIRSGLDKRTALLGAARAGSVECMRELLHQGAGITATDYAGATTLMLASRSGNIDAVRLAARSASVNQVDRYGRSPLVYAIEARSVATVKFLLGLGARTDQADSNAWTPLHVAGLMDATIIADLLIKSGAQIDSGNAAGETPLALAASVLNVGVVKVLLRSGADPHKFTKHGQDALMAACSWDYGDADPTEEMEMKGANVVHALLQRSDLAARDSDGKTALDLASNNRHPLAARIIREEQERQSASTHK